MPSTITFVDGSVLADVTTYALVDPSLLTDRAQRITFEHDPQYSVFTGDGQHRYVAVGAVRQIDREPRTQTGRAWYDLPGARSAWAADAADLGV